MPQYSTIRQRAPEFARRETLSTSLIYLSAALDHRLYTDTHTPADTPSTHPHARHRHCFIHPFAPSASERAAAATPGETTNGRRNASISRDTPRVFDSRRNVPGRDVAAGSHEMRAVSVATSARFIITQTLSNCGNLIQFPKPFPGRRCES